MTEKNPLLKAFPITDTIKEPRQIQTDSLNWIWETLPNYKKIALCLPTGSGKSAIGMSIMNNTKSLGMKSLYCSPLNTLVVQLQDSFKDVTTLRGRKHYPCLSGRQSCATGFCQDDVCAKKRPIRNCKDCDVSCQCPQCIYRKAFRAFKDSDIGNTNFTTFLLGINNNPDLIIVDEADSVEDFIRLHFTLTLEGHLNANWENTLEELKTRADYLRTMLMEDDEK